MRKAYALMTDSRPRMRILSKYLHNEILKDSLKCRTLDTETTNGNVPAEVRDFLPDADVYLAEIFYAVSAEVIVTTDVTLCGVRDQSEGRIRIRMRDEFLAEYLRG